MSTSKVRNTYPLWCGGKECANDSCDTERPQKKKQKIAKNRNVHTKKVKFNEQEDELESVFQKLRKKHGSEWSGRLWARATVSGEYDCDSQPPPMHLGSLEVSRRT